MFDDTLDMSERNLRTEGHRSSRCSNRDSCEKPVCDRDRRRLLGALATGGAISLAGCTGLFAASEVPEPDEEERFDVEYTAQERTLGVRSRQTVLGAGLDEGLDLPFDCKAGFCGVCLSQADGDASDLVHMSMNDVEGLNEDAIEAGYFLPCTSQPRADFSVDTDVSVTDLREFEEDDEDEEDVEDEDDEDEEVTDQRFHSVTYVQEQWNIQVPEDLDLLEAGENVGLELPYQCRVGNCGQCLARADTDANEVVEMTENNYDPLDEDAIEEGYFLTCTGFPRADFELESNTYGDLD